MTRFDIGAFVNKSITDSNLDHNDYVSHSGWSPNIPNGQQFTIGAQEAKEMVYEINKNGWFNDPMVPHRGPTDLRGAILAQLAKISTPEAARDMPKGSMRPTRAAARILNDFAKQIGADATFAAHQTRPSHPIG